MLSYLNSLAHQYEDLVKAFGDLAPFFASLFLAYIAYQQWQTSERQRRKELFELRYKKLFEKALEGIKCLESETDETVRNDKLDKIAEELCKYQYLIKEKHFNKLVECMCASKQIFHEKELRIILDPYLSIEPEETIWAILKNCVVGIYEFLTPKFIQDFIANQVKISVILSKTKDIINYISSLLKQKWQDSEASSE